MKNYDCHCLFVTKGKKESKHLYATESLLLDFEMGWATQQTEKAYA